MSSWLWPVRIPISLTKNTDGNYSLVWIKDPDFCWRLGEWWRWARKEMLGGELWWKIIWERECMYVDAWSLCCTAELDTTLYIHDSLIKKRNQGRSQLTSDSVKYTFQKSLCGGEGKMGCIRLKLRPFRSLWSFLRNQETAEGWQWP